MTDVLIITMASVFVGFLCTGGAFAAFMNKKSTAWVVGLLILALILVTVVPVTIAVVFGTTMN